MVWLLFLVQQHNEIPSSMSGLYVKTAWRNLMKHKLISLINILGLSIGLTCSVLAIYYAYNEYSYESCHQKADRISRVYTFGNFGAIDWLPNTFPKVAADLRERYPEVENAAVCRMVSGVVMHQNVPVNQNHIMVTEPSVNDILSIRYQAGQAPQSGQEIGLSRKMALKYFGNDTPLGQSLQLSIWGQSFDYTVTGVFNDLPANTHCQVACQIPFNMAEKFHFDLADYDDADYTVFVLARPGTDWQAFNLKLAADYKIPADIQNLMVSLVPIKKIHFYKNLNDNNLANLLVLLSGGIIALVLSCISYINLNSILASSRFRELGIRKAIGGNRRQIRRMLLADAALTAGISFLLALFLSYYLLPGFNTLMSRELSPVPSLEIWGVLLILIVLVSLISGILPARKLNRSKTVSLLFHPKVHSGKIRYGLLAFQFVVAIVLLQFFIISHRQTNYMFQADVVKCNADNVWMANGWYWGDLDKVKDELLKCPDIETVSWGSSIPGINMNIVNNWKEPGNTAMALDLTCESDYAKVFQIKMLQGRYFSDEYPADDQSVVINSLTAQVLGYDEPLGKSLWYRERTYQIIGVIDNYQAVPVIFDKMPIIMTRSEAMNHNLFIRARQGRMEEAREYTTGVLAKINPTQPVELTTFNDIIMDVGKSYRATGTLIDIFTLVVICNAMMGLFGLSLFVSQFRDKEVGIRKVCGASGWSIIRKLSKGFALQLLVALVIATPISMFLGKGYVSTFANHISMTPDLFLQGGALAFLMVVLATGSRIGYAATRNPVEVLRYE